MIDTHTKKMQDIYCEIGLDEIKGIAFNKLITNKIKSGITVEYCNIKIDAIKYKLKRVYRSYNFIGGRLDKQRENNLRKVLNYYIHLRKRISNDSNRHKH